MKIVPSVPEPRKPIKLSYARALLSWFGFVLFLVSLVMVFYVYFEQKELLKTNNNLQPIYWGLPLEVYFYIGMTLIGFLITAVFGHQSDETDRDVPYGLHASDHIREDNIE